MLARSSEDGAPSGAEANLRPNLAFYIDVRPALDDWEGVRMRWSRWWVNTFGRRATVGPAGASGTPTKAVG